MHNAPVSSLGRFVSEYRAAYRDPRAAQKKRDQWCKGQSRHSSNRKDRHEYAKPWKIQKKKPQAVTGAPEAAQVSAPAPSEPAAPQVPAATYMYQAAAPKKEPKYYNIITGEAHYD